MIKTNNENHNNQRSIFIMIAKTSIPSNSLLNQTGPHHYEDSYSLLIDDNKNTITLNDIAKAFLTSSPVWIKMLMSLRNKLVAPLGLKTGTTVSHGLSEKPELKVGSRAGIFKIIARNENEIIAGEDDKHLNFKVSLWLSNNSTNNRQKEVIISTAVHFNNWIGRLYFLLVKPFHKLIVPAMLKQMAKGLHSSLPLREI